MPPGVLRFSLYDTFNGLIKTQLQKVSFSPSVSTCYVPFNNSYDTLLPPVNRTRLYARQPKTPPVHLENGAATWHIT